MHLTAQIGAEETVGEVAYHGRKHLIRRRV
jgi:hypothetical protein